MSIALSLRVIQMNDVTAIQLDEEFSIERCGIDDATHPERPMEPHDMEAAVRAD